MKANPFFLFMEENTPNGADAQTDSGSGQTTQDNSDSSLTLEEALKKLQYLEGEAKKAFQERDAAKAKTREFETAEEERKRKALEAKGEYETLIKSKDAELEKFKADSERLSELVSSLKNELLDQLNEDHREIAGKLDLDDLRKYVKLHSKTTVATDAGRPGATAKVNVDGKSLDELSLQEQRTLRESNWSKYVELFKSKYGYAPQKRQ